MKVLMQPMQSCALMQNMQLTEPNESTEFTLSTLKIDVGPNRVQYHIHRLDCVGDQEETSPLLSLSLPLILGRRPPLLKNSMVSWSRRVAPTMAAHSVMASHTNTSAMNFRFSSRSTSK